MASLVRNIIAGVLGSPSLLHPREAQFVTGNLGALNAEVITDCDGSGSVSLDLRGTFSATIEVAGTIDGVNWTLIPVKPINQVSKSFVSAVAGVAPGSWVGSCAGFRKVRARVTSWTSGSATTALIANIGLPDWSLDGAITPTLVTATGVASAAVTLTLPAPGAGLRHYITYLSVNRFASALLTAGATPVLVTTTNIPGALVLSMAADAAAAGSLTPWREDFAYALATSAQNTATTIVCPVTTGVIWRVTAGYYVAP